MIFVKKSAAPPVKLSKGESLKRDYCSSFDADSKAYKNGTKKFEFNNRIFGHENVKAELLKAQFNKCCYCESKIGSTSPGDVEHYRPKAYSQQDREQPKIYPGYYWFFERESTTDCQVAAVIREMSEELAMWLGKIRPVVD